MTTTASTILTEKVRHPSSIGTTPAWLISKDFQEITTINNGVTTTGTQIRQYDGTNLLNVGNDKYSVEDNWVLVPTSSISVTSNPSTEGWYIWNEDTNEYILTTDNEPYFYEEIDDITSIPYNYIKIDNNFYTNSNYTLLSTDTPVSLGLYEFDSSDDSYNLSEDNTTTIENWTQDYFYLDTSSYFLKEETYTGTTDTTIQQDKTYYQQEFGLDTVTYSVVTPLGGENPSERGWYELTAVSYVNAPNYIYYELADIDQEGYEEDIKYVRLQKDNISPNTDTDDRYLYFLNRTGIDETDTDLIFAVETNETYYQRVIKTNYYYQKVPTTYPPQPVYINDGVFIGVTGFGTASTLSVPISIKDGGTGATNAADAKINLGIPSLETVSNLTTSVSELAASISSLTVTEGTIWDVPVSILNGGTSATSAEVARANLGLGLISTMNGAPGCYNTNTNELWHECYIYSGTKVLSVNTDRYEKTIWDPQEFVTNFHLNPFNVHSDGSYTEDLDSYTTVQETWQDYNTARTISRRDYTYVNDTYNMFCVGVAFSEGDGGPGVVYKPVNYTYGLGPLCAEFWGIQTSWPGWHARWQHKTGNTGPRRFNYIVIVPRALHMDNPPTHLRKIGLKDDNYVSSSTNVTGRFWGPNDRY